MTPADLRDYVDESRTIGYEFDQLVNVSTLLRRPPPVPAELRDSLRAALIEAYAVHVRAIAAFFFARGEHFGPEDFPPHARGTDLLAEDYIPAEHWPAWQTDRDGWTTAIPENLWETMFRSVRVAAHMTARRPDPPAARPGFAWECISTTDALRAALGVFLKLADSSRIDPAVFAKLTKYAVTHPPAEQPT
jgi:hypothetical protein